MALKIKALKGFKDILPDEVGTWQFIESSARDIFTRFGFSEIKVPILEKTALFARSIGETTDIVEKEMYTFEDRNGAMITMRPEGTASVLRAFIEHSLNNQKPVQKLFTIGPMFRHERPQKGRLRQFHQMSVEVLGADQPLLDAEVMAMAWSVVDTIGLPIRLEINSLGCPCCRPDFNKELLIFLEEKKQGICQDCQRRREKNPLRVLDCKNEVCQQLYVDAPSILNHLCTDCADHFSRVKEGLELLKVPFTVNSFMVRGLDYYTRTTFELITDALGAQSAVGAGGRYDGLIKQLGGPALPGIGFALGMERLVLLVQEFKGLHRKNRTDLFVAALGEAAQRKAFTLIHALRKKGITAAMDYGGKSLKSQMKQADKLFSRYVLIMGDDELDRGEALLRNMATKDQVGVALEQGIEGVVEIMKRPLEMK